VSAVLAPLLRGARRGDKSTMMKPTAQPLVLAYAGCSTCRSALSWLSAHGITPLVRPIVDAPPTPAELSSWIPASGLPIRKWLNTSGQSYRALGKAKVDAASDADIAAWLSADGKLVKRPVLVAGDRVLVGFKAEAYQALLSNR
jgi:arsenate reductase